MKSAQIVEVCTADQHPHTLLTLDPYASNPVSETASQHGATTSERTFSVTSVSWAPSCGRSYHLIATGSRDGHVRIWKLIPPFVDESMDDDRLRSSGRDSEKWSGKIVGDFPDHE